MLSEHKFGPEAIAYLKGYLADGLTLSKSLLDLPLDSGRVFAQLPPPERIREIHDFEDGALDPEDAGGTYEWLKGFVADYLKESGQACAIFEHALADRDDPWLAKTEDRVFFHHSEVYYFVTSGEEPPNVADAVDGAHSGYFVRGVLTVLPDGASFSSREQVSAELIHVLKANVRYVLIGVYDQDAYLVWSR